MQTSTSAATKAVTALAIVVGVAAIPLAGGASVSHSPKPITRVVHAITTTRRVPAISLPTVSYKFSASYSGTISILWNGAGSLTATITGRGKGIDFGFASVTGSGSATANAQSDPINGAGILIGKGETLHLRFVTGATAAAAAGAAPTVVDIAGTAVIVKGTGRFACATGTLKVSGAFSLQSTSGKERDAFNAMLKGVVKVKK